MAASDEERLPSSADIQKLTAEASGLSVEVIKLIKAVDLRVQRKTMLIKVCLWVLAVDIVFTAAFVFGVISVSHLSGCQARISAESRAGLAARSNFADVSTDADLKFLDAQEKAILGTPNDSTQAQRDTARTDWLTAIQDKRQSLLAAKQVRADHPITPAHDC